MFFALTNRGLAKPRSFYPAHKDAADHRILVYQYQ